MIPGHIVYFLIDEIFISLAIRDREDLFDELFNVIKEAFEIKNSLAQCIIFKILEALALVKKR